MSESTIAAEAAPASEPRPANSEPLAQGIIIGMILSVIIGVAVYLYTRPDVYKITQRYDPGADQVIWSLYRNGDRLASAPSFPEIQRRLKRLREPGATRETTFWTGE